jgi:phage FluMu protein Com
VANDENVDGNAKKPSVSTAKELSSKLIVVKNGKFRNVTTIICEFCKYGFEESSILIHIAKSPACKSYYGPRFDEMKKQKSKPVVHKAANQSENVIPMATDESVDRNIKKQSVSPAKKSTSNLADLYNGMATIFCEFCKTVLGESTLMMHVGKNPACKSYYSPIFIEMKKKNSTKAHDSILNVQVSKDHLEKKAVQISLKISHEDLYNSMATICCEFCKTVLGESTLMMHVGKNPECKSYYRPRFIEIKKEKSPKAYEGKNSVSNVQISKDHLEKLAEQNVILK